MGHDKWPVLHVGSVPRFDPQTWDFKIWGLVEAPPRLDWEEFSTLPAQDAIADMHCVTRWSRFDVQWRGVLARDVLAQVKLEPEARYVMVHTEQGFTSNVPLRDLLQPSGLLATHHEGEPLPGDHGYPLRLVVSHLYAWKSVKWYAGWNCLPKMKAASGSAAATMCMATRSKSSASDGNAPARQADQQSRVTPGNPSKPASKLRICSMPCCCITPRCTASRAERRW